MRRLFSLKVWIFSNQTVLGNRDTKHAQTQDHVKTEKQNASRAIFRGVNHEYVVCMRRWHFATAASLEMSMHAHRNGPRG